MCNELSKIIELDDRVEYYRVDLLLEYLRKEHPTGEFIFVDLENQNGCLFYNGENDEEHKRIGETLEGCCLELSRDENFTKEFKVYEDASC